MLYVPKLYHKLESLKGRGFSKNVHKLPKNHERRKTLVLHAVHRTVALRQSRNASFKNAAVMQNKKTQKNSKPL